MDYEQMISRLEDGLTIIESVHGDLDVACHAYIVAVPNCTYSSFSDNQIDELTNTLGWSWDKNLGWVFSCLG